MHDTMCCLVIISVLIVVLLWLEQEYLETIVWTQDAYLSSNIALNITQFVMKQNLSHGWICQHTHGVDLLVVLTLCLGHGAPPRSSGYWGRMLLIFLS